MKKIWVAVFSAGLIISCSDSNTEGTIKEGEVKSKLAADGWSEDDYQNSEVDPNAKQYTTLAFDKYEHDFGKVFQGTDNKYIFKVTNTGSAPLIINDASASCGCTVPKKPENPIEPGGTGEIEVIFSPKPGQTGIQSKTVTIKANTDPIITTLKITADVMEKMM